jgi:ABC-type glycerol-3-phosphate transport system substrate-binding protein
MAFHRKNSLRVPFVLIVLFAFLLSACVAPAPGSGGQAAATEKPKLTIWAATTFTPDADTTQDDQIKAWGEANGVEIDLACMSQDERTPRWQTAIESKQFPDCAAIEQADLPKFVQEGVLVETTEVMQSLNALAGGFTDGAFLAGRTADGKHWSVPSFSSTEVFYVRKDKLEEKGLALPETWEDVLTVAQAINDPDNQFWGWGKQMGTPSWDSEVSFTAMLWAFGGKTWDEEGKPAINSPETRQLLDFLKSAWDAGVIPPDGPTWDDGGNNRAYQSEIVGLTLNTGGSESTFSTINCAAARAWAWLSATTKPNTWPMCSTRSMAKTGSSWINVASSLSPGISSVVTTARTPGAASTALKSNDTMRPRATGLRMGAACSVPSVKGKSSM